MTVIDKHTPRRVKKETRRRDIITNSVKWGQLKLLVGEIYWLVDHWDRVAHPQITLVVVGAAAGNHYRALADMFPDIVEFHLYDSNRFAEGLVAGMEDRIKLFHRYFTLEDAAAYRGQPNVFLAVDLRRMGSAAVELDLEVEDSVWEDHLFQMELVRTMQPASALLKFRPPYFVPYNVEKHGLEVEYLGGTIYGQCFVGLGSTETRLVPSYTVNPDGSKSYSLVKYGLKMYEYKLFYYRTSLRDDWEVRHQGQLVKTVWLNHLTEAPVVPDDGELLNCFDTMYLFYVLDRYLAFMGDTDNTSPDARLERVLVCWNWVRQRINDMVQLPMTLSQMRQKLTTVTRAEISDLQLFPPSPVPVGEPEEFFRL